MKPQALRSAGAEESTRREKRVWSQFACVCGVCRRSRRVSSTRQQDQCSISCAGGSDCPAQRARMS